jgi:hypothetical protein
VEYEGDYEETSNSEPLDDDASDSDYEEIEEHANPVASDDDAFEKVPRTVSGPARPRQISKAPAGHRGSGNGAVRGRSGLGAARDLDTDVDDTRQLPDLIVRPLPQSI